MFKKIASLFKEDSEEIHSMADAFEGINDFNELPLLVRIQPLTETLNDLISVGREKAVRQIIKLAKKEYEGHPQNFLKLLDVKFNDQDVKIKAPPILKRLRSLNHESLEKFVKEQIIDSAQQVYNAIEFLQSVEIGDLDKVKLCFELNKFSIDITDDDGQTALSRACLGGHTEVIKYLISQGANPDHKTARSFTPLINATYEGKEENIKLIMEALEDHYSNDHKKLYSSLTHHTPGFGSALRNGNARNRKTIRSKINSILLEVPHEKLAIVGSGFSGTRTAIEVLRQASNKDKFLEIVLIEKDEDKRSGGLAYSFETANDEHVINIQAQRMSPFPEDPNHFLSWLRRNYRHIYEHHSDAVPREIYQEYLDDTLQSLIEENVKISVTKKTATVVDIDVEENNAKIYFDSGDNMEAVHIVLATGHTTSAKPDFLHAVEHHPRVLDNQWGEKGREFMANMDEHGSVFIIGTSMSAFDAVVSLKRREEHKGKIVMLSRNGYIHPTYEKDKIPKAVQLTNPDSFLNKITNLQYPFSSRYDGISNSGNYVIEAFKREVQHEWFNLTRQGQVNGEQILTQWERFVPFVINSLQDLSLIHI